jgi:recombination protein RecA
MPAVARADLETLLQARKLDRTLTTALPCPGSGSEQALAPTGIAALDQLLNGGLPRGQLSEVVGPRSSGRTSVSVAMLAAAIARGELVALVDALDMFDPSSAAAAGIDLARLLWVRGEAGQVGFPPASLASSALSALVDRAIKALNLVLQAGGFGLVVLDLAEVPATAIRRLPFTTWLRLQRVLEGSATACIVMGAEPTARSSGGITIALRAAPCSAPDVRPPLPDSGPCSITRRSSLVVLGAPGLWAGETERVRLLLGLEIEARIIRARATAATSCRFQVTAHRAETGGQWPVVCGRFREERARGQGRCQRRVVSASKGT